MDIVKLRKLSYKSILGFGQYSDMTVHQIIGIRKGFYLKWVYFNIAGISFTDDVLDELKLFEPYRVKKPGAYPDLWKEYFKIAEKSVHGLEGKIKCNANKGRSKARYIGLQKSRNIYSKKSILQAKNQGH